MVMFCLNLVDGTWTGQWLASKYMKLRQSYVSSAMRKNVTHIFLESWARILWMFYWKLKQILFISVSSFSTSRMQNLPKLAFLG